MLEGAPHEGQPKNHQFHGTPIVGIQHVFKVINKVHSQPRNLLVLLVFHGRPPQEWPVPAAILEANSIRKTNKLPLMYYLSHQLTSIKT